jgi:hypothetical protein
MTRMILTAAAALGLAASAPSIVSAAPYSVDVRQADIQQRIDAGLRSGQLTSREAARLRGDYRTIAELEKTYRETGPGLTMSERRDLQLRLDRLSRQIFAYRNNSKYR